MAHSVENLFLDCSAVVLGCSGLAALFAVVAPRPYMDEVFHVPQTIRYCEADYGAWDPKITTFPGLYVFGAGLARGLHSLLELFRPSSLTTFCSTTGLRALNVLFAGCTFATVSELYRQLHPRVSRGYASLLAALVVLFPIHFFFIFLYYTDVGSLLFVLLASLACRRRLYRLSALAAAVAVLFRQTNAVWAAFILMEGVLDRTLPSTPRWQRAPVLHQLTHVLQESWRLKWELGRDLGALASVPLAFAAFVVRNGGIVVGDKANHKASLHLVQLLYFAAFAALSLPLSSFGLARLQQAAGALLRSIRTDSFGTARRLVVALFFTAYVVQNFTLTHPFLLADNRHYTFYIWKDILGRHPVMRYSFIPLYIFSAWSLQRGLTAGGSSAIWQLGFAVCTAATLVPSPLLEFRYFLIPFALVLLHTEPLPAGQLLATAAMYGTVNAITIYVFLFRPFTWPDGSVARFMW
eukprot:jgi/Botrbrau1/2584/Bobra.145_1s0012.1